MCMVQFCGSMDSVSDVEIDEDGVFKYILIELCEKKRSGSGKRTKLIVRGYEWAEFHGEQRSIFFCPLYSSSCSGYFG